MSGALWGSRPKSDKKDMAPLKLLLVAGYSLGFFMTTTYKRTLKPLFLGNSEGTFFEGFERVELP